MVNVGRKTAQRTRDIEVADSSPRCVTCLQGKLFTPSNLLCLKCQSGTSLRNRTVTPGCKRDVIFQDILGVSSLPTQDHEMEISVAPYVQRKVMRCRLGFINWYHEHVLSGNVEIERHIGLASNTRRSDIGQVIHTYEIKQYNLILHYGFEANRGIHYHHRKALVDRCVTPLWSRWIQASQWLRGDIPTSVQMW